MKKMFFVGVMVLAVMFAGGRANAFEISGVRVDGEQIVLQTTYGGDIFLTRGQNAVPQIIKLCTASRSASIRDFRNEKEKFHVIFLKSEDLHSFSSFLRKTGDEVEICNSSLRCSVFIFF